MPFAPASKVTEPQWWLFPRCGAAGKQGAWRFPMACVTHIYMVNYFFQGNCANRSNTLKRKEFKFIF